MILLAVMRHWFRLCNVSHTCICKKNNNKKKKVQWF